MPIATRVILEMYGLIALPASVVVPFPVKVAHPKRCLRETRARVRAIGRCPGTLGDIDAIVADCNACRACFGR